MFLIKTNKVWYYIKGYYRTILPPKNYKKSIKNLERKSSNWDFAEIERRINYYNKLKDSKRHKNSGKIIEILKKPISPKAYFFDTYEYAIFFNKNLPIDYVFGDVVHVPKVPSIVKSRPISDDNQNSILLNLDKARHFVWVKNDKDFLSKKDVMIGRGAVFQQHRIDFFEKYFDNPLCDLGQVNKNAGKPELWWKPKISIKKHLDYKFILSLQGNDVATNLKWIMSSNSIAVMPKPTVETWFMEGTLEGGKHFIEIKPDYSDLEEQLKFYIANPEKCKEIIKNAHQHCEQFFNKDVEDYCSLKVLEKYFIT